MATAAGAADFTGPYFEARGGLDNAKTVVDGYSSSSKSGFAYGGAIGYDLSAGNNVIVGGLAGFNGSTVKDCDSGVCLKAGRDIEALVRLGYAASSSILVYALGGYANGRATLDIPSYGSYSQDYSGFRVGGGIEQDFNAHAFLKIEYRYTSYGKQNIEGYETSFRRHQVLAALGYRF